VFHKSRLLYGLHLARQAFRDAGGALVCEGQLDVIACHRAGLTHAVSPQGTAFTEEHARMLKRFASAVTFAFDADTAGEKAAVRSLEIAHAAGLKANVVVLPEGEDPDSLSRAAGAEALAEVMSAVHPAFPFALSLARRHHDMESADGKARAVGEVLDLISTVPDPVQRAAHCQWLSTELRLPESALFDALNRALRGRRRRGGRREPGVAPPETPRAVQDRASTNSSLVERATLALLDLALHFGFIAHELIELLPPDELSETPASRALNLVMAHTEQGEWSLAARELAADQGLAGEPEIARLLVESDFAHLDPGRFPDQDRETLEIRLRQAMADCLEKFEQASIDERLPRLQRKWLAETDPECQRELGRAVSELAKRRDLLRRSRRSRTRQ